LVKFYDLNIVPQNNTSEKINELLTHCFNIGYNGAALSTTSTLLNIGDYDSKVIFRKNITAQSIGELKNFIRTARDKKILIAVYTQNSSVANWCASTGLVKILSLDLENIKKLQRTTIKLVCENNILFEISLREMIYNIDHPLVKKISVFSDKIREILDYKAGLIISSGASNVFQLRPPRDVIAFANIFSIEEKDAKRALSTLPEVIFRDYATVEKGGG